MKLVAVDSLKFSDERLDDALKAAIGGREPIELLVSNGDVYKTHAVDWHGGARYPHLERDPSRPDLLAAIVAPRTALP
jgi:hypothetical protein